MRLVLSLYRWRQWLAVVAVMVVLGLLAPHWVMAGEHHDRVLTTVSHLETSAVDGQATAALHHYLDHQHSHDVGTLLSIRFETALVVLSLYHGDAQSLLRLPVAFGIDRPPRG
jgi:hypothetical protein